MSCVADTRLAVLMIGWLVLQEVPVGRHIFQAVQETVQEVNAAR
jgi:hypothetical protein